MKKNRTIGKTVVMEAAAARGLRVVRMVDPEDGRRKWRVDDRKGEGVWAMSLADVWFVVGPRPVKLPSEAVVDGDSPSPLTPLPVVEGNQTEEEGA